MVSIDEHKQRLLAYCNGYEIIGDDAQKIIKEVFLRFNVSNNNDTDQLFSLCFEFIINHIDNKYRNKLIAFCKRFSVQTADAEDIAQETLLRFSTAFLPGRGSVEGFLFEVCKNITLNVIKKNKKNVVFPPGQQNNIPVPTPNYVDWKSLIDALQKKLSEEERIILILYLQGDTQEEIAFEIEKDQSYVSRTLKKIRDIAAKIYKEKVEGGGI